MQKNWQQIRFGINMIFKFWGKFRGLFQLSSRNNHYFSISDKPKLHIGCGPINLPGWINIDARSFEHVHIVTDKIDLHQFADNSIGEIYLCHVLEHFSFVDVDNLLKLFSAKLCSGGLLRLSVPDFRLIVEGYHKSSSNLLIFRQALMGGQDYPFNFHKSVYDVSLITDLLYKFGFTNIERWHPEDIFGANHDDWSNKCIETRLKSFPISLNICAQKK